MSRSRYRFTLSLRALLILIGCVALFLACISWFWRRCEQQRIAVALIESLGNDVYYRRANDEDADNQTLSPSNEKVLRRDWRDTVTEVSLMYGMPASGDPSLARAIGNLVFLEGLHFNTVLDEPPAELLALWAPLKNLAYLRSVTLPDYEMIQLIGSRCPLENVSFICGDAMNEGQATSLCRFAKLREICNLVALPECMEPLSRLAGLEKLEIEGSQIGGKPASYLARLQNLRTLSLRDTNITDDDLIILSGLTHLEYLNLEGTKISDAGLFHLHTLKKLRSLSIGECMLSGEGLRALWELESLKQVNLTNAGALRQSSFDEFATKRPDVNLWVIDLRPPQEDH